MLARPLLSLYEIYQDQVLTLFLTTLLLLLSRFSCVQLRVTP